MNIYVQIAGLVALNIERPLTWRPPGPTRAWLDVTAGDFFELAAFQTSGGNLDITTNAETWFSIEMG